MRPVTTGADKKLERGAARRAKRVGDAARAAATGSADTSGAVVGTVGATTLSPLPMVAGGEVDAPQAAPKHAVTAASASSRAREAPDPIRFP